MSVSAWGASEKKSIMTDLSEFSITKHWPAGDPKILQLYSLPMSSRVKAPIMLGEIGLLHQA